MQVDFDRLSQYHESGKVRHSVDPSGALHVWCYSVQTVYSRDWDDLTRLCRGLVTDGEGNVISRPFPKFFNWGEPEAPGEEITAGPFWAYDKMDGSLIVVGNRDGEAVVSTKGSFTTWHSETAREMLEGWKPVEGSTAIFEFIHPDNRIVVDYSGASELVLLGAVANEDGCDHFTPEQYADESGWYGRLVAPHAFRLQAILQTTANPENGPNREGFVLLWPNPEGPSPRVKIKFAQYMNLHRALSRLSNVAVWEALSTGTLEPLLEAVPDEMFNQVRECADELNLAFNKCLAATDVYVAHAQSNFITRKDKAEWILANAPNPALVFKLLDNKNADEAIWREIKPERDTTWTFLK